MFEVPIKLLLEVLCVFLASRTMRDRRHLELGVNAGRTFSFDWDVA
jgi:hypothetical protein